MGFCRGAAGSSERVDGGGLDDTSFERGQRKESIAYMAGASLKSLESSLRVFETMRATGSRWESTSLPEVPTRGCGKARTLRA